jgi:protein-L-isoaspartate(D-aspartate) O-methyltransferase
MPSAIRFLAALALLFTPQARPVDQPLGRAPERAAMVANQIAARGVRNAAVLEAMRAVPRHLFVPPAARDRAYDDRPLPIGHEQTISQPFIVAYMSEALDVSSRHRVLEVGTGSGYQTAVLGRLARQVFSIEIVPELGSRAAALLGELGYHNVVVKVGDGYLGWPEHAPFDRIIVTAAPDHVPQPLVQQLAVGGRMVIPVGPQGGPQELLVVEKGATGVVHRRTIPVVFVPLTRK